MQRSPQQVRQLSVEATLEIQNKLQNVLSLIQNDAQTIANQKQTIERQQQIIINQKRAIELARNQLISIKKQLLINEARSCPQDFRTNLQNYLLDLKTELDQLNNTNTSKQTNQKHLEEKKEEKYETIADDRLAYGLTKVGKTALYIAAARAIESKRGGKDRLFLDECSDKFASANHNAGYEFISLFADALSSISHETGGKVTVDYLATFAAFRSKWIDDSIYLALKTDKERMRNGLTSKTIKQMVILGAACDTRCFRMSRLPRDFRIYHVDSKDAIAFRESVLGKDLGACQYKNVMFDFVNMNDQENMKWTEELIKNGFDFNKKCIWICEGFIEYLEEKKMENLFKIIETSSLYGSWLIGEVPNRVNVALKGMHDIWVKMGGQRVITGIDEPNEEILNKFGFNQFANVNVLGTNESNYNDRSPKSYVEFQKTHKPCSNDKIARIQLFRACKAAPIEDDVDDEKRN